MATPDARRLDAVRQPGVSCSQPLAGDFERSLPYPWTTPGAATAPGRSTPFEGYGRGFERSLPGDCRWLGRGVEGDSAGGCLAGSPSCGILSPSPTAPVRHLFQNPLPGGFKAHGTYPLKAAANVGFGGGGLGPLALNGLRQRGVGVCQDPCHPLSNPMPPPFQTPATPLASNPPANQAQNPARGSGPMPPTRAKSPTPFDELHARGRPQMGDPFGIRILWAGRSKVIFERNIWHIFEQMMPGHPFSRASLRTAQILPTRFLYRPSN